MDHMDTQHLHEPNLAIKVGSFFVVVIVLLCVFQSASLLTLSYDLPSNKFSEFAVSICEAWHAQMQALGAAELTEWVAEFVEGLHDQTIHS